MIRFIEFIEGIGIVCLHPFSDALFVPTSAVATTHLLASPLFRPTHALRVPDSLSGSCTHLALLADRRGGWCSPCSVTGQQSTGLFQLSNLGVNRGENRF